MKKQIKSILVTFKKKEPIIILTFLLIALFTLFC